MGLQVIDATVSLHQDLSAFFVEHAEEIFRVTFPDGSHIDMGGKWLFLNMIFWRPLLRRGMRVDHKRHTFHNEAFTDDIRKRIHTEIVYDCRGIDHDALDALKQELQLDVNLIYNLIEIHLGEHHRSVSIYEIAETLEIPELAAVVNIDITEEMKCGIKAVEAKYEDGFAAVLKAFSKPHPKNVFYPLLSLGALNTKQFPQVVAAGGTRTDVDETMINMPIRNSYLTGFRDIVEYAIDSLAAKKSHFYNDRELSTTQYSNRKQQLLASTIRFIYSGDCGTQVTVPFLIHRRFAKMVLGKNIVLEDGSLLELDRYNIERFHDKTVYMRSVMTCRYQDGYCETCGGGLTRHFPRGTLPGILSAIEVMSPVAQQVLSNKHVAKTHASEYKIPEDLRPWFTCVNNEVYFKDNVDLDYITLAVPGPDVDRLTDLQFVEGNALNDQYFSKLSSMYLARTGTDEPIASECSLLDRNKAHPYFSSDFLRMIKHHPEVVRMVVINNVPVVHIDTKHFDRTKPVMRAVVVNDSTRQFVRRVEGLFSNVIASFTDCSDAIREVSNVIWERATPNILHLETMIRASMISSPTDYGIPQLSSTECRFAPLAQIIPRREIGTQLAFERWSAWISDPGSYILPKRTGAFDVFLRPVQH